MKQWVRSTVLTRSNEVHLRLDADQAEAIAAAKAAAGRHYWANHNTRTPALPNCPAPAETSESGEPNDCNLRHLWAMVSLTWREAVELVWWLGLVGMALLLIVIPQLGAVDDNDRLKLAVAFTTSLSGFLIILLSILLWGRC